MGACNDKEKKPESSNNTTASNNSSSSTHDPALGANSYTHKHKQELHDKRAHPEEHQKEDHPDHHAYESHRPPPIKVAPK